MPIKLAVGQKLLAVGGVNALVGETKATIWSWDKPCQDDSDELFGLVSPITPPPTFLIQVGATGLNELTVQIGDLAVPGLVWVGPDGMYEPDKRCFACVVLDALAAPGSTYLVYFGKDGVLADVTALGAFFPAVDFTGFDAHADDQFRCNPFGASVATVERDRGLYRGIAATPAQVAAMYALGVPPNYAGILGGPQHWWFKSNPEVNDLVDHGSAAAAATTLVLSPGVPEFSDVCAAGPVAALEDTEFEFSLRRRR